MKKILLIFGFLISLIFAAVILYMLSVLISNWQFHRHYNAIIALRDRIQANPNDSQALDSLLAYLPSNFGLDAGNAAGCFRQLADGPENKVKIVPVIAPRVVPALVKQAEHIGRADTEALTEYGDYVLPYKADLIAIIRKHPDEDTAWFAAEVLGNFGPKAKDALPIIESMPTNQINHDLIEDAIKHIKGQQ
jgi:hypothetical protein